VNTFVNDVILSSADIGAVGDKRAKVELISGIGRNAERGFEVCAVYEIKTAH
jgi:hypothetical protein